MPDVDADPGDHGVAFRLREDAGALLFAEQDIVGPTQVRREARDIGDGVASREPEGQHDQRQ